MRNRYFGVHLKLFLISIRLFQQVVPEDELSDNDEDDDDEMDVFGVTTIVNLSQRKVSNEIFCSGRLEGDILFWLT